MVASIQSAADALESAAAARQQQAENYGDAADLVTSAQANAEAEYGDNQVPRFDKVN